MSRSGGRLFVCLVLALWFFSSAPAYSRQPIPVASTDPAIVEAQWPGSQGGYPGYAQGWDDGHQRCWRMRERLRETRERAYYAPPWERERLESRVYWIRERLRQECWGRGWE